MNTANIKKYAPLARNAFITAVTKRANELGIYDSHSEEAIEEGQILRIEGRSVDLKLKGARNKLHTRVESTGFTALMEHIAYTWFNRLCAIRYMELHDYLKHGYRVLSHPKNNSGFEILEQAQDVAEDLGLNRDDIIELKLAGNKDELLYRTLLLGQCHKLHQAMPFLFEAIDDETELLLPDNLTRTDSILRGLVDDIPEQDWEQVEVIGWLYQFYISEKKDQVIGKVVKSEDIPAATQLFTPNWIVKYLVQNSVGRQWLQTYPDSSIKAGMEYYIEPAEQTDEVGVALATITPDSIEPETIKVLDPACGSGHILVEAYQVLKAIYQERGYRNRDIPQLILENNLFGLDIDDRAAQLAGFALMMLARADDRRIFTCDVQLNVMAMQSTVGMTVHSDEWLLIAGEQERHGFVLILQDLLALFEQAKTFGSLIEVPDSVAEYLPTVKRVLKQLADSGDVFAQHAELALMPIIKQAEILAQKYDVVVANPPYMGSKGMNADLKKFAKKYYPNAKSDLFAVFIERGFNWLKQAGFNSMVTMQSWMFLSSYEKMREHLLDNYTIETMTHMGNGVMKIAFGTNATIFRNVHMGGYKGFYSYVENDDVNEDGVPYEFPVQNKRLKTAASDDFKKIPGSPIAYWVSDKVRDIFANSPALGEVADARQGLATADNDQFLRYWHEVAIKQIGFGMANREQAQQSGLKWFPYNKGGQFRKWYGNQEYVVNWQNDGEEIRNFVDDNGKQRSRPQNTEYYFKSSVSWSDITSSSIAFRFFQTEFIYDVKGQSAFIGSIESQKLLLSYCNNNFILKASKILNPSLSFQVGNFNQIPFPDKKNCTLTINEIDRLINQSKTDWNTYETSWDFQSNPLIVGWVSDSVTQQIEATDAGLRDKAANPAYLLHSSFPRSCVGMQTEPDKSSVCIPTENGRNESLASIYNLWQTHNRQTITEMQCLEEENNRLFIEAYGLQDELTPDVPLEQITLTVNPKYRYGGNLSDEVLKNRFQSDTLAELISYAIGCMMGRYSLDQEGLVYAHTGNEGFTELVQQGAYKTFPVDDNGIIPLTDQEWFADDATHRFREFVRVVWGEDNLQTNLDFIAESLCLHAIKPKSGESSLETIRRYLSTKFYKDHLKTYKKRPIYWLFSSGKQKAFECLVYLHRYNKSTLSRMRTEYVTPLLGKYEASAMVLQKQMQDASSTAESNRFKKSLIALEKKQTELSEFDDKLKHYADRCISLDLDEGVKVNYGKFGDLLAEVKAVTGKK